MKPLRILFAAILFTGSCWAARCLATFDPRALQAYEKYVGSREGDMLGRLAKAELSWVPDSSRKQAETELNSGRPIRRNVSVPAVNERIADWNGAIVHWIGAIRIKGTRIGDLKTVLQDYDRYPTLFHPIMPVCRAKPIAADTYDVTFELQNVVRVAALFSQHYSFRLKSRSDYSDPGSRADPALLIHWRATEIRESISGIPGRDDFLDVYKDHGIFWGFNTYWLARQQGQDLYVEFESITLARSVRNFKCRVGLFPVPKSLISGVMESLPADSLELMLSATKAECERGAANPGGKPAY